MNDDITFDLNNNIIEVNLSGSVPGARGEPGPQGEPGYTPIKGIDYFDGEPGPQGEPGEPGPQGEPGYTPIKGIDYFDGEPGPQGEPGYTPIKGIDYFDGLPGLDAVINGENVLNLIAGANIELQQEGMDMTISASDVFNKQEILDILSDLDVAKLESIEYGAQVNVNADWEATSGDAEILNKPIVLNYVGHYSEGSFPDIMETKEHDLITVGDTRALYVYNTVDGWQEWSQSSGSGSATEITITNSGGFFTGSTVDEALEELGAELVGALELINSGGILEIEANQVTLIDTEGNYASSHVEGALAEIANAGYIADPNYNTFTNDEKTKLAGIQEGANNFELPSDVLVNFGTVGIPEDGEFVGWWEGNGSWVNKKLPVASDEIAGVVKIGNNLTINEEGVLSATGGSGGSNQAVDISIADNGGYYESTEVEGALQEVGGLLDGLQEALDTILGPSGGGGGEITLLSTTPEAFQTGVAIDSPIVVVFDAPSGYSGYNFTILTDYGSGEGSMLSYAVMETASGTGQYAIEMYLDEFMPYNTEMGVTGYVSGPNGEWLSVEFTFHTEEAI